VGEHTEIPQYCRKRPKLDIREIRKDMGAMDKKIADLDRTLTRSLASNRVWVLLQGAAILGVLARGFKWL
jgi:hypothetical protein